MKNWTAPEDTAAKAVGASEPIVFSAQALPVEGTELSPATLTLPEAIRRSLATDPGIQAALSRVRIAQAEADQTRLLPNPVLSIAFRYPSAGQPIVEAGLAEEFLSIIQKPGLISAADDRLRAAGASAVVTVLDTLADVQTKYVTVQALDALLSEIEKRQTLLAKLLELARARLDAGEGILLDVTTIDAERLALETDQAERKLERREERLALSRLIGDPNGEADWTLPTWSPSGPLSTPATEWVKTALRNRPEIQAKHWELSALGAERRLSWLAPLEGAEAGVDSERDESWSVGPSLSLPLPLFDFGSARRDRIRAAILEASHQLTGINRQVIEDVRRAHAAYLSTEEMRAKVADALIPLADRRLFQAQSQYEAGEADITTLFLAEQNLSEARTRLVELQQKSSLSLIRLERAVGGPGVAAEFRSDAISPSSNPAQQKEDAQ